MVTVLLIQGPQRSGTGAETAEWGSWEIRTDLRDRLLGRRMHGSLFWKRGAKDVLLVETACTEACVRGRVLCTSGQQGQCVSSAGNMRGRKTRDEGGKVSRDQSHGEPLWEKGAEAVAPKISLCF